MHIPLWLNAIFSPPGSKAQGAQPGSAVYGGSLAPIVSQGSSSFSHSSAATTTAPYSTDTSADYSQYSQAYTQVQQQNTGPLHRGTQMVWVFLGVKWESDGDGGWRDEWWMSAAVTCCKYGRQGGGGDENGYGYLDRQSEWGFGRERTCLHLSLSLPLS